MSEEYSVTPITVDINPNSIKIVEETMSAVNIELEPIKQVISTISEKVEEEIKEVISTISEKVEEEVKEVISTISEKKDNKCCIVC